MTPEWVADAVFYQIFPDRFAKSASVAKPSNLQPWGSEPTQRGYQGGDLRGVVERLDHLEALGVDAIYFTPIFQSGSNHRYHTHDYYRVDPLLGGDDAFEAMLRACHERKIRVVLDGVFNHVGRGFFQFHDLVENGKESPWRDWFRVRKFPLNAYRGKPNYDCWWGIPELPKLDTDHPGVQAMLWDVAEHWARRGIDGWRLDVPSEITTPGFWETLRARVKAVRSDFYLVGELWNDASAWLPSRFDGTMGYWLGGHLLVYAAQERFRFELTTSEFPIVQEVIDARALGDHVEKVMAAYPPEVARSNLGMLGSHDTARLRTLVGGDRRSQELAALMLFAMPGAPCIYYGDEIGLSGGRDPDCRRAFPWQEPSRWDGAMLETYRALIRLRRANVALRRGRWRRLSDDRHVFAFAQEHDEQTLWIAVNASPRARTLALPETSEAKLLFGDGALVRGRLALPARAGAVFSVAPGAAARPGAAGSGAPPAA